MGNSQNSLPQETLNSLSKDTDSIYFLTFLIVKAKDIKKIYKKFSGLDKDKKGYVSADDFSRIPEIEKNPLRYYICQHLSSDGKNEEVDFEQFIKLIDIFKNNKSEDQYKCNELVILLIFSVLFQLFDFNKDGKICYEDLLINLKLLLGNSLNEEQISEIVDKTIQEYSSDQKFINLEEFVKIFDS
jgi:serine/threonine-protein phosphatase 2B regulatory subunit